MIEAWEGARAAFQSLDGVIRFLEMERLLAGQFANVMSARPYTVEPRLRAAIHDAVETGVFSLPSLEPDLTGVGHFVDELLGRMRARNGDFRQALAVE